MSAEAEFSRWAFGPDRRSRRPTAGLSREDLVRDLAGRAGERRLAAAVDAETNDDASG
jgi:hypothetical protein